METLAAAREARRRGKDIQLTVGAVIPGEERSFGVQITARTGFFNGKGNLHD